MNLNGATALVTGGSNGIGLAIAKALIGAGSKDVTVTTPEGTSATGGTANDFVVS